MIILGLLLIAGAGYGYLQISNMASSSRFSVREVESLLYMGNAFGIEGMMTAEDRFLMFTIQNRMILLILGGIIMLTGFFVRSAGVKQEFAQQEANHSVKTWTCSRCFKPNPEYKGKCQYCGTEKKTMGQVFKDR